MKQLLWLLVLLYPMHSDAQSQSEMNRDAYEQYEAADAALNNVYQQILTSYSADSLFLENLRHAQRVWIKFRDAELAMKYPAYPPTHYGSMHAACSTAYLTELTENRTETLKIWLTGLEEGEVCNGSVKHKAP